MKYCKKCGAELAEGVSFCEKCGNPVGKVSKQKSGKKRWVLTISSGVIILAVTVVGGLFATGVIGDKDNESVASADKKTAMEELVQIIQNAEQENAAEIILEAKGFEDAVVSISGDSADVIVNMEILTDQMMAQITDIVKRKTDVSAENIVITPVKELEGDKSAEDEGSDYFSSAKLSRDENRARNKETLLEIINNETMASADKKAAVEKVSKITRNAEQENEAEMMLEAKGFEAVVSISGDSADVIVNVEKLTDKMMAQIVDVVNRKSDVSVENIVITPVKVEKE